MRGANENKTGIVERIINSMVKMPPAEKKKVRVKSPVRKFNYQLPKSFFDAVDNARVEAGYDILPRFHHLSVSPSSEKHHHSRRESRRKHDHSPSASHRDVSSKKAQVRRKNHKHSQQHHHQKKKRTESSSASPSSHAHKTPSSKRSNAK